MLYNGLLLLMLLPILFLFYSAVEIYRRNPARAENRAACIVMLLLLALFLIDFAQLIAVHSRVFRLTAFLKYPLTLLAAGTSIYMNLLFARNYHRIPRTIGVFAVLGPVFAYAVQLTLYGPSFFIARIEEHGRWTFERPTHALLYYLSVCGAYSVANMAIAFAAWRRSDARFDQARFLVLLRANAAYIVSTAICIAVGIVCERRHIALPSTITLVPVLIWGAALRLLMMNADILPRLARKYEVLFRMSPAPIMILDRHGRIMEANPQAAKLFGLDAGAKGRQRLDALLMPDDRKLFNDMYTHHFPNICWKDKEMTMLGEEGNVLTVLMDMGMMAEDGEPCGLAIIRDITKRKQVERYTEYLARHDTLTGLPNRNAFKLALEEAIADDTRGRQAFDAVLLVDLDRFKLINETLGHQHGDDVLKIIAARFRERLQTDTLLARAGGDEFMLLLRGADEYDELIRVAEKLLSALEEPVVLFGSEYYLSASIGISLFPGDGETADAVIKNADIAMYHAKSNGGSQYRFFSQEWNASIKRMVDMEASLRRALDEKEIYVVYQPQTDIASGRTIGAEALLRWNSKDFGMVPPSDFIPIAEETGLIIKLGQWVLEEACKEAKRWEREGWSGMTISVNVSAKQFMQPDFAEMVKRVLNETGLEARKLCIEITESIVIDKLKFTLKMLDDLVGIGIGIAIDDFGTGYSSLSLLRQLPISVLKIDKSFVSEMVEVQSVRAIVAAMITMSHQLGKSVVAEGIESEQQMAWLQDMRCDVGQGYYIDKPLSAEAMLHRLSS